MLIKTIAPDELTRDIIVGFIHNVDHTCNVDSIRVGNIWRIVIETPEIALYKALRNALRVMDRPLLESFGKAS